MPWGVKWTWDDFPSPCPTYPRVPDRSCRVSGVASGPAAFSTVKNLACRFLGGHPAVTAFEGAEICPRELTRQVLDDCEPYQVCRVLGR